MKGFSAKFYIKVNDRKILDRPGDIWRNVLQTLEELGENIGQILFDKFGKNVYILRKLLKIFWNNFVEVWETFSWNFARIL